MALYAETPQIGNGYCPQIVLEADRTNQTDTSYNISYKISYVAYGYGWYASFPDITITLGDSTFTVSMPYGSGSSSTLLEGTLSKTYTREDEDTYIYGTISYNFSGATWSGSSGYSGTSEDYLTIFARPSYKITYNPNNGTGGPGSQTVKVGRSFKVPTTVPTRANYTFNGWTVGSNTWKAGQTISTGITANTTATAKWVSAVPPYTKPTVKSLKLVRDATTSTTVNVSFSWTCSNSDKAKYAIFIDNVQKVPASGWTSLTGTSGTVSNVLVTNVSDTDSHIIMVKLYDSGQASTSTTTNTVSISGNVALPFKLMDFTGVGLGLGCEAPTQKYIHIQNYGRLELDSPTYVKIVGKDIIEGSPSSTTKYAHGFTFFDSTGPRGYMSLAQRANGSVYNVIMSRKDYPDSSDSSKTVEAYNSLLLGFTQDNKRFVEVSDASIWRTALGMGEYISSAKRTTGTDDWSYIKFGNGNAICWRYGSINSKINIAWGNSYCSNDAPSIALPFTFTSAVPGFNVFIRSSSSGQAVIPVVYSDGTTSEFPSFFLLRPDSVNTSASYYILRVAIGRWK